MYNNIQQQQTTNDTTPKVPWMNSSSSSKRATHHICWNRTTGWLVWCLSTLPTIVLPPFAQDVCTEIGNFIWIIKILHALRENCLFIQWAPYLYLSLPWFGITAEMLSNHCNSMKMVMAIHPLCFIIPTKTVSFLFYGCCLSESWIYHWPRIFGTREPL